MGIEPTLFAWEAKVLPLNYTRWVPKLPSKGHFRSVILAASLAEGQHCSLGKNQVGGFVDEALDQLGAGQPVQSGPLSWINRAMSLRACAVGAVAGRRQTLSRSAPALFAVAWLKSCACLFACAHSYC